MRPSDFALNILASWLGNQLNRLFNTKKKTNNTEESNDNSVDRSGKIIIEGGDDSEEQKKFRTFDVFLDIDDILPEIEEPVGHLIIETIPSTFYHLTCFVIESKKTNEWYVFHRGRMSFESTHGGWTQTYILLNKLKENNVTIALWSLENQTLSDFECGRILWHEVKPKLVPLKASLNDEQSWDYLKSRAQEIINEHNS